jgi:hypothetical protein
LDIAFPTATTDIECDASVVVFEVERCERQPERLIACAGGRRERRRQFRLIESWATCVFCWIDKEEFIAILSGGSIPKTVVR